MNEADITGIVFIVIGLLCVLPILYASPLFVVVSGGFIAAGIVLIVSGGNMCRAEQDRTPGKDQVYAELKVKEPRTPSQKKEKETPPLTKIPA